MTVIITVTDYVNILYIPVLLFFNCSTIIHEVMPSSIKYATFEYSMM